MRKLLLGLAVLITAIVLTSVIVAAGVGNWFVGPTADVAGVKAAVQQAPGRHASGAHVIGDFALVQWYDAHVSAPAVYKRISGERWKEILPGGGVMLISDMVKAGVPTLVAKQLCSGWPKENSPCEGFN
jgi:hypothetical protein